MKPRQDTVIIKCKNCECESETFYTGLPDNWHHRTNIIREDITGWCCAVCGSDTLPDVSSNGFYHYVEVDRHQYTEDESIRDTIEALEREYAEEGDDSFNPYPTRGPLAGW